MGKLISICFFLLIFWCSFGTKLTAEYEFIQIYYGAVKKNEMASISYNKNKRIFIIRDFYMTNNLTLETFGQILKPSLLSQFLKDPIEFRFETRESLDKGRHTQISSVTYNEKIDIKSSEIKVPIFSSKFHEELYYLLKKKYRENRNKFIESEILTPEVYLKNVSNSYNENFEPIVSFDVLNEKNKHITTIEVSFYYMHAGNTSGRRLVKNYNVDLIKDKAQRIRTLLPKEVDNAKFSPGAITLERVRYSDGSIETICESSR